MYSLKIERKMSRREVLVAAAGAFVAVSATGCGAMKTGAKAAAKARAKAAEVGRVVVRVAWRTIGQIVSAVIREGGRLVIVAMVEGIRREIAASLNETQATSLQEGGTLILRSRDGTEHSVQVSAEG